ADLLVDKVVGSESKWRAVQLDALGIRNVASEVTVEGTRTEALGPREVSKNVRGNVPGYVRAVSEAAIGRSQVLGIDIRSVRKARRRPRFIAAKAAGDGAILEVVETVVTRAPGDGQHLGNQVEVN